MAELIRTVRRFDVLLLVVAIDMSAHSEAGIKAHQADQCRKIRAGLQPSMRSELVALIDGLANRLESLPTQLYVQSVLLTRLVEHTFKFSTLYYSQRIPKTLGAFAWRVDQKDVVRTPYETLWRDIVGPFLQARSLISPLPLATVGDYSFMRPFMGTLPEAPAFLRQGVSNPEQTFEYCEFTAVLENLKFADSRYSTGIQLVDMLAAGVRRACNGTLQPPGWKGLGRLMPKPEAGTNCVRLIALERSKNDDIACQSVIMQWDRETRDILTKATRRLGKQQRAARRGAA